MSLAYRIAGAAGLVVLGLMAAWFFGVQVTRCLGPLGGKTMVEAIRDGCIEPSVGPGMPIAAVALVAASLLLITARAKIERSFAAAAAGALIGLVAYWFIRPTSFTGPTSAGEIVTVALSVDRWAILTAGIVGSGVGWLVGRWPRQYRLAPVAAVVVLVVVAACNSVQPPRTPPRALGFGEMWVPVELWEPRNGIAVACGGVGFEGEYRLHGSPTDPRVVWMTTPDGSRQELAWPLGYSARFTPELELLDETGKLAGREGSLVVGGCETPQPGVMWVDIERMPGDPA